MRFRRIGFVLGACVVTLIWGRAAYAVRSGASLPTLLTRSAYRVKTSQEFKNGTAVTFRPSRPDQTFRLGDIEFPPAAQQGPRLWYIGYLALDVDVFRLPAGGSIYISANTDRATFDMVKIIRESAAAERPRVHWSTFDLVRGHRDKVAAGKTFRLRTENYLPYAGVQPGRTPATLHVEQFGGAKLRAVTVRGGIARSSRSPYAISLRVRYLGENAVVGKPFTAQVHVAPKAENDVLRRVAVSAQYPHGALSLRVGSPLRQVGTLRRDRMLTYEFVAHTPGKIPIDFVVTSTINGPVGRTVVTVSPAHTAWLSDRRHQTGLLVLLLGGLFVAGGATIARQRARGDAPRAISQA